jgi:hypothetical protein
MVDGHAIGCLHHTQHELTGDQPLLGHAKAAHIATLLTQAFSADGGQVVEDNREFFIDQWAQQMGHRVIDGDLVVHERIHAAQQLLVAEIVGIDARHAHGLQPAKRAQLGVGIAQAVEDHHTNGLLNGGGVTGASEDGRQGIEAQLTPELIKGPYIAQGQGRLKANLGRGDVRHCGPWHAARCSAPHRPCRRPHQRDPEWPPCAGEADLARHGRTRPTGRRCGFWSG